MIHVYLLSVSHPGPVVVVVQVSVVNIKIMNDIYHSSPVLAVSFEKFSNFTIPKKVYMLLKSF